jgi:hypothetical protein
LIIQPGVGRYNRAKPGDDFLKERTGAAVDDGGRAQAPFRVDGFEERFLRVVAPRLSSSDRQPWAEGFESRWDSFQRRSAKPLRRQKALA